MGLRAIAAAWILGLGTFACGAAPATKPNVVLIVIDTLRRDHVGFHGHASGATPQLDALAAEALVVEDASANAPWTKPAVATLFTSRMPAEHGAVYESPASGLMESQRTLAEVFSAAGYRTGAFSENPNVHRSTGFAQGFDVFRNPGTWTRTKRATVEAAVEWLAAPAPEAEAQPFFLFLHFLDPHSPYFAPPRFRERFTQGHASQNVWAREGQVSQIVMESDPSTLREEDLAMLKALYDAEIHWVDTQVRVLVEALTATGQLERSVVLVTSDHGEEFLENGRLAHGPWLSEELLRIPLLLRVPGATPRRVGGTGVSQLDVAPTLLELASIPVPAEFAGRSFAGLVHGEAPAARAVHAETHNAGTHRRSVRDGRWKLVRDELAGTQQLYDLETDPGEDRDVAEQEPDRVASLSARLGPPPVKRALPPDAASPVDPDRVEALRALGYLDGREDAN